MWKQGCSFTRSKKKKKNSIYQSYHSLHCTDKSFSQLSLTSNGWNYNKQLNMLVPVWFYGTQFSPSIIRKK